MIEKGRLFVFLITLAAAGILAADSRAELQLGKPAVKNSLRENQSHVLNFQGNAGKDITGPYDLKLRVYEDEHFSNLLFEQVYPNVQIDEGKYEISLNQEEELSSGEKYWLRIEVLGENEIPAIEARLEILDNKTVIVVKEGSAEVTISEQVNVVGSDPDHLVGVWNRGTGRGIVVKADSNTALYAEGANGKAIETLGDVDVTGNLTVSGETSVNLPVGSVSTAEIADGTITETDISPVAKINADTLDGRDSTDFTTPWIQNGPDIYYDSGKVGIGISDPTGFQLKVEDPGHVWAGGFFQPNDNVFVELAHDSGSAIFAQTKFSSAYLMKLIGPDPQSSFYVGGDGNVGIGTTNPYTQLMVAGGPGVATLIRSSSGSAQLALSSGQPATGRQYNIVSTEAGELQVQDTTAGGIVPFRIFGNSGDSTLVVKGSSVGIGTTNPQQKLDVNGNIRSSGEIIGKEIADVRIATQFSSIQEAINSLPAEGGHVYIPAGTYNITSTIFVPSNVTLQGAGKSTILKAAGAFSVIKNAASPATNEGIVLRDFKIDGSGVSLHGIILSKAYKCYLENIIVEDSQKGVEITNDQDNEVFASYTTLESVKVFNSRDKGIVLSNSSHISLSNCMAVSGGKEGFWASGTRYITLTNCHAYGNAESGFKPSYGSIHWTFNSCIARDNAWSGFDLAEAAEGFHVLNGCIAENNQSRGGFRTTVAKVTFNGCYARNNKNSGIKIDGLYRPIYDITVSGGIFESNTSEGIVVDGAQYTISDVTINGVRATNQSYGVRATGSYQYIILTGSDTRGNSTDGISIPGANVIVANNFE